MRRHRRFHPDTELDITAFMNLMIVLVPILLLNLIFAQTAVLELNFPANSDVVTADQDDLALSIYIEEKGFDIVRGGGERIVFISNNEQGYDFEGLSRAMQDLKKRIPDKKELTLLPFDNTSYQAIISTMDAVRSYQTVVAGSLVEAELFPEIAIASAGKAGVIE